jgi:hypothetical protein
MGYVLDATIGDALNVDASKDDKAVYQNKVDDASFVQSGMLFSMESEKQKRFEKMGAFEIITDLKAVLHLRRMRRGMRLPSYFCPLIWTNIVV